MCKMSHCSICWKSKRYSIDSFDGFTTPPRILSPCNPVHNLYVETFQGQKDSSEWELFVSKLDDLPMMQLPISMKDVHDEKLKIVEFFREILEVCACICTKILDMY